MTRIEKTILAILLCGVFLLVGFSLSSKISSLFQPNEPVPYGLPLINGVTGDSETALYHAPDCVLAQGINSEYAIEFDSARQAETSGFHPCPSCFQTAE